MPRARLLLPLVAASVLLTGCGTNEIDGNDVEKQIVQSYRDMGVSHQITAQCPEHVASVPGRHFSCTVTIGDRDPEPFEVTVNDDHGGFGWRINRLGGGLPSPEFGPPVG